MIGVEWISYEIGALVVGSIDSVQLAINAIIMHIITIAYGVSFAVTIAIFLFLASYVASLYNLYDTAYCVSGVSRDCNCCFSSCW